MLLSALATLFDKLLLSNDKMHLDRGVGIGYLATKLCLTLYMALLAHSP